MATLSLFGLWRCLGLGGHIPFETPSGVEPEEGGCGETKLHRVMFQKFFDIIEDIGGERAGCLEYRTTGIVLSQLFSSVGWWEKSRFFDD